MPHDQRRYKAGFEKQLLPGGADVVQQLVK
jgi:hypothetical protein